MSNPADAYESYMVPALFTPWAAKLVDAAEPRPGERVLDVGCGTGIVARTIASRFGSRCSIAAVDLNPNMLTVARAAAARERLAIDLREAQAEQLPFSGGSFDVVLSQFALMFFTDRLAALREMRRVAAATGRLVLSVWQRLERHPFYQTLHAVIVRRLGMSAVQDIFALGSESELKALVMAAGFHRVSVESDSMVARFPNPDGFLAGEIDVDTAAIPSMQQLDTGARKSIVTAISADMEPSLRRVTRERHVELEFHAYFVRAWP